MGAYNVFGSCSGEYDVVPSDSVNLANFGWIRATGAGNIKYTTVKGETVTRAFSAGEVSICAVRRVWNAGTTATGIICYY